MKELSSAQLKQFMGHVIALQSQIMTGNKVLEELKGRKISLSEEVRDENDKIQYRNTKELMASRPVKGELKEFYGEIINDMKKPEKPQEPEKPEDVIPITRSVFPSKGMLIGMAFVCAFVAWVIFMIWGVAYLAFDGIPSSGGFGTILILWVVFMGIYLIANAIVNVKENKNINEARTTDNEAYNEEIKKYNEKLAIWEKESAQYEKLYEEEKAKRLKSIEVQYKMATDKYNKRKEEVKNEAIRAQEDIEQKIKDIAVAVDDEVQRVQNAVIASEKALAELYALDILHENYRELPTVCSLYGYLETGRCSSLEGHEGAYNLYEAELRQNMIITKLDAVIDHLEAIEQNQYVLHKQINEMQKTLSEVSMKMTQMLRKVNSIADNTRKISNQTKVIAENTKYTKVIAENTAITALCAQMTAKNTEALKYISLVS